MHIDWFVFFCQIVNFLLLLFLLKKFLYGRIVGAMDAREAKITATFVDAGKAREEARESAEQLEKRLRDMDAQFEAAMNRAHEEAEAHRKKLMDKAREEVDLLQARWVETLRSERDAFLAGLRQLAGTQIYSITRQVLRDLADVELEQRIVEILMERIQTMNEEERGKFRDSLTEGATITVQSAFDIPADERKKLDDVIRRHISGDIQVVFEKSDNVMTGYELKTDGHKIAWSIKEYLDSLEEKFYHALYEEAQEKR
jgi:F-type H+-transporting ATPase subunit b